MKVLLIPFDRHTGRPYAPVVVDDTGETHWMLAAREASNEQGLRAIELHPFEQDSNRLLAWALVAASRPQPDPHPGANQWLAMASRHRSGIDDDTWTRDLTQYLEALYLSSDSPYMQSGKSGGAEEWEGGRRVIADAVTSPGTFLDTCCANGLLMESMATWAGVEPYGLDISARLVDLARSRLPHWADRIWVGDARTWLPPRSFDYVYSLPEITLPHLQREMITHLLERAVASGGRLIAGQYLSASNDDLGTEPIWDRLASWGLDVAGTAVQLRADDPRGPRTEVAWIVKQPGR
jgi:hypothetical protein